MAVFSLSAGKEQKMPEGILVSDFDGTMTRLDFYDLVCQAFPQIAGGYWQDYESGKLSHFDALRLIFAGIRASEIRLMDIISRMQIEPQLLSAVSRMRQNGWEVVVASAGCDWYIKKLLDSAGVDIPLYANPGVFSEHAGLEMRRSALSVFSSEELGVNKVAVVRAALQCSTRVAFAGDGRPDMAPALLVPPQRRFAKSWLAKKLHEINEPFRPFDHWSEVVEMLKSDEGWSA